MWLADRHSDQELYTAAKHCAKIHLVQLHQTEEFLNLPLRLLIDIIKGGWCRTEKCFAFRCGQTIPTKKAKNEVT